MEIRPFIIFINLGGVLKIFPSDNTSAISISKNPVTHSKTKHIPMKYHFLQEQVLEQKVKLEYVPSKEQVVDIFTKPLPRETFEYLRQKLGVVSASSYC